MKCVVIGGSGFVGSRLIPELQKNWNIINLDKINSKEYSSLTHCVDVREPHSFRHYMEEANTVILLAAEHADNVTPPSLYFDVNVQGMRNVLDAMELYGVQRIIFTSSVAIYGLNTPNPPSETELINPFNDYGRSKWEAEQILENWVHKDSERSALILRPTVIFGEGNRGNVYNLLNQIYYGRFLMVGDGRNKKSMSYVGNVVGFIAYMLNNRWHGVQIFNYVDTPDFDMNTLVSEVYKFKGRSIPYFRIPYRVGVLIGYIFDFLAKLTQHKFSISSIRIKKFCANTVVDGSKLNATQFIRPYNIKEGLQKTLESEFGNDSL